jgi:very-short-patch-repair endonuclease
MPKRTALPFHLQLGPFGVADALASGISPSRLRGKDLRTPFRGVRIPHIQPLDHVDAYAQRMPAHQHFSHITAALLWGFELPPRLTGGPLHVTAVFPHRGPRIAGVIGHQGLPDRSVMLRRSVRVSTAADTWCALATTLSLDELIIAGDSATRRKSPLTSLNELAAAVSVAEGKRGNRRAREALGFVRARTDSSRETELRLMIIRSGLPEPIVNYPIRNEYGAFVAFGDLAYPEYKVLVEYDGGQHREDEKQFNRDIDRLDDVMELDWRVIRVNKSHVVARSASRLAKIRTALVDRGWKP